MEGFNDTKEDEELLNIAALCESNLKLAGQSEASNVKDGADSRDEAMKDGDALQDDIFNDGLDEELLALVDVIESGNNVEEVKEDIDDFEELGLTPPSDEINIFLSTNFGIKAVKPLQWKIIKSLMEEKRDQCVIMPTGYGKSLCYQFQPVYEVPMIWHTNR